MHLASVPVGPPGHGNHRWGASDMDITDRRLGHLPVAATVREQGHSYLAGIGLSACFYFLLELVSPSQRLATDTTASHVQHGLQRQHVPDHTLPVAAETPQIQLLPTHPLQKGAPTVLLGFLPHLLCWSSEGHICYGTADGRSPGPGMWQRHELRDRQPRLFSLGPACSILHIQLYTVLCCGSFQVSGAEACLPHIPAWPGLLLCHLSDTLASVTHGSKKSVSLPLGTQCRPRAQK